MELCEELLSLKDRIAQEKIKISKSEIISLIDLTLLDEQALESDILALGEKAVTHQVAAICVYPKHLTLLKNFPIKKATVINFPSGEEPQEDVTYRLKTLLEEQTVDEIDYVFPYRSYLSGEKKLALSYCKKNLELAKEYNKVFKVILETGEIEELHEIFEMSSAIAKLGCHFLKTSTGKTKEGASMPAVFAMLSALKKINSSCGVKVSGGVKTITQAQEYIALAKIVMNKEIHSNWFRIGASGLLDQCTM
ncbi:deoxyribose-phosphate aldolase (plasmid) [Legionella adelaidensis]|uniref:Deoxyribose-phosphate aldolase n=1 Tax=Legionella adelaidensis TaxID=45056 RepID=A0A0W0R5B7_9GAMM|nr:deoxyribose-phosphate aldolase [Legionella adelaidensis]KTC66220.1 2-deoxyribose-5-phosphate aldolase [Legionella adelaidensis]VEH85476.1 deoxyribose-phosphate aldolase [Legionella adelaidensis]